MKMHSHHPLSQSLFFLLLSSSFLFPPTAAYDPDPNQDFCVAVPDSPNSISVNGFPCKPSSSVTSDDFFSTVLSVNLTTNDRFGANASFADALSFPGLNALGISLVRVVFAPAGLVQPHTHPRATELVFVTEGQLLVGFVATDGSHSIHINCIRWTASSPSHLSLRWRLGAFTSSASSTSCFKGLFGVL